MFVKIQDGRYVREDYINELVIKEVRMPGGPTTYRLVMRTTEGPETLMEFENKKKVEGTLFALLTKFNDKDTTSKKKGN